MPLIFGDGFKQIVLELATTAVELESEVHKIEKKQAKAWSEHQVAQFNKSTFAPPYPGDQYYNHKKEVIFKQYKEAVEQTKQKINIERDRLIAIVDEKKIIKAYHTVGEAERDAQLLRSTDIDLSVDNINAMIERNHDNPYILQLLKGYVTNANRSLLKNRKVVNVSALEPFKEAIETITGMASSINLLIRHVDYYHEFGNGAAKKLYNGWEWMFEESLSMMKKLRLEIY